MGGHLACESAGVAWFGARTLSAGMVAAVRVARVVLSMQGTECAVAQLEEIRERWRDRRLLVYFWVSDVPLLLALLQASQGALASEFASVCGGTFIGRGVAEFLGRYGRRSIPLRRSATGVDLNDIRAIIREPAPLFISADGSGQARRVHPSLGRLVRSRGDLATPLSVTLTGPCAFVDGRARPTVAVSLGPPIELSGPNDQGELMAGLVNCRKRFRSGGVPHRFG